MNFLNLLYPVVAFSGSKFHPALDVAQKDVIIEILNVLLLMRAKISANLDSNISHLFPKLTEIVLLPRTIKKYELIKDAGLALIPAGRRSRKK
jgi:hypothetical protein